MSHPAISKADIANAKNGCYECELCRREIERMAELGLDVGELAARNEHLNQFYQKLIDLYSPLVLSNPPS
jgi:hypothetical protein